jgi:hypothetical protein
MTCASISVSEAPPELASAANAGAAESAKQVLSPTNLVTLKILVDVLRTKLTLGSLPPS